MCCFSSDLFVVVVLKGFQQWEPAMPHKLFSHLRQRNRPVKRSNIHSKEKLYALFIPAEQYHSSKDLNSLPVDHRLVAWTGHPDSGSPSLDLPFSMWHRVQAAVPDETTGHRTPSSCEQYLPEPSGPDENISWHDMSLMFKKWKLAWKLAELTHHKMVRWNYNRSILMSGFCSLTIVLMPWEKGRSWISPGTRLWVSRAEHKALEQAVVKRCKARWLKMYRCMKF